MKRCVAANPCAMLRTSMSVSGTGSFTWASFGITSTRRNFSKMPDAHRVLEICGEGRTGHRERGLAARVADGASAAHTRGCTGITA